jgi:hypothetical protein
MFERRNNCLTDRADPIRHLRPAKAPPEADDFATPSGLAGPLLTSK